MISKFFLRIIILLLIISGSSMPARAAAIPETEAAEWVKSTGYKFIDALSNPDIKAKHQTLDEMFENYVDTNYMARFVLGNYWKKLDDAQKEIYLGLFKRYTVSLYKSYPLDFNLTGLDFVITSSKTSGNYTDVGLSVTLPEQFRTETLKSVNIEFKLAKTDEQIKIVDLKIAESSLLLTYRNRFMTMIKDAEEEMEWFLEDLADLTESNEKNAALNLKND